MKFLLAEVTCHIQLFILSSQVKKFKLNFLGKRLGEGKFLNEIFKGYSQTMVVKQSEYSYRDNSLLILFLLAFSAKQIAVQRTKWEKKAESLLL